MDLDMTAWLHASSVVYSYNTIQRREINSTQLNTTQRSESTEKKNNDCQITDIFVSTLSINTASTEEHGVPSFVRIIK